MKIESKIIEFNHIHYPSCQSFDENCVKNYSVKIPVKFNDKIVGYASIVKKDGIIATVNIPGDQINYLKQEEQ